MNTDSVRCRYTRTECEDPALYKVGKCDLCFVAEEARGDIPRVDRGKARGALSVERGASEEARGE